MRKRIYRNFIVLLLASVLILTAIFGVFAYHTFRSVTVASVKESAELVADFLNRNEAGGYSDYISAGTELRITLIAPDGTVLLDNRTQADTLENHGDRSEVIEAREKGRGENTRYSNTLAADTYYYAVQLSNGDILRMSKTVDSIMQVFASSLIVVSIVTFLIIILADFAARRLTGKIVEPLYMIDFSGESGAAAIYEELAPYIKKINQQKAEIDEKMKTIQDRADTIEAITKNMKEGVILINNLGMTLAINQSAMEIFGEDNGEPKDILYICRDMDFQQGVKKCLAGQHEEMDFEWKERIYRVFFSPVQNAEGLSGGAILFFDITEKHELEKQRREFSANVSHELKTPLTSISAMAEVMRGGLAKEEDVKSFADKILTQAKRLIRIIEDIIRLSEFDENKIGKDFVNFDIYELAEAAAEALRPKAEERGIKIELSGERFDAFGSPQMIDELFYNLIDNAVKYNRESGKISVTLSEKEGCCKISVSDTGIGIPPEQQGRVFERFYRVDASRSKKTGGTGLGLSIVKHIAEYHGGRVELMSKPGEGTTVLCYIAGK